MKSFLIRTNSIKDPGLAISNRIGEEISRLGGSFQIAVDEDPEELKGYEAAIVLGGDGTILRAAKAFAGYALPIVGVNLGTLGFLAEIETANISDMVRRLIDGDYQVVDRMHLGGGIYRDGACIFQDTALNDVVVSRSGHSKLICLRIFVNDKLLDVYEADGVIVSTPTGSTGYNLSAGGPIVSPDTDILIITPISPHSLTSKSIVFPGDTRVRIEVVNKRPDANTDAYANFDGNSGHDMQCGDEIEIVRAKSHTALIRLYEVGFYDVLRNKICHL